MPKVKKHKNGLYYFECPGCGCIHQVNAGDCASWNTKWDFNGNVDSPTFDPSVKCTAPNYCCHFFIKGGTIQFCGDCTHEFKDQILDMKELDFELDN